MARSSAVAPAPAARLHHLDALRGGALLLGVLLHALMPFAPGELWLVNDDIDSMPAVLVELGFLTDRDEAAFLASDEGQDLLASAIFRAVRDLKTQYERGLE